METFYIDYYDKNACKRAQEHCLSRYGVGEPPRFVAGPHNIMESGDFQ